MEFNVMFQSLQTALGGQLPAILGAVGIGLIGWVVAAIARSGVRRAAEAVNLDGRFSQVAGSSLPASSWLATGVFALVLVLTAIAVLNALNLASASSPLAALATEVTTFLPRLLAGLVLAAVAWLCATVVRAVLSRIFASKLIDARLSAASGERGTLPISRQIATAAFWLTLLLFLPAVLGAFQLDGLLAPVQGMMTSLLGMLPNLLAAAIIGVVGYFVAKLLRAIVSNVLDAAGVNRASQTMGLPASLKLSSLAGTVVYVLVLFPTMIAALDALKIESISGPASLMLGQVFAAVPNIIAAGVILAVTYFVARIVAGLATEFLAGIGLDGVPQRLGFSSRQGALAPSAIAGKALMFFAMLFATIEAANRLGFVRISELATSFIRFGGDLILGGFILVVGFWLANLAHDAIQRAAGETRSPVARIARIAIIGLVAAMGLRAMGIASDIVNLAFGLTLGMVAVAGALSFGLGGREAAGKQMERWLSNWQAPADVAETSVATPPLPDGKPLRAGIFATTNKPAAESNDPNPAH